MRLVSCAVAVLVLAFPAAAAADPILDPLAPLFPKYAGAPAVAHQLKPTRAPQNPFMARNPRNNIHNDTWMTDAYQWAGPIGQRRSRCRTPCRPHCAARSPSTRAASS